MTCTTCGQWELATGDLACAWCGTSYLRLSTRLTPETLNPEDYPPPVALQIQNNSPLAPITIDRITTNQPWLTLLPNQILPAAIAPGSLHTFLLDADTFAASHPSEATLTITARFAPNSQTATLRLQPPNKPHTGSA
jgi:hypothetical protein